MSLQYLLSYMVSDEKSSINLTKVFPGGSDGKESTSHAEDPGLIPEWEVSLEKEMGTHSSILAWKIPWAEEPGRPESTGSQRVGHDWAAHNAILLKFSCM